MSYKRLILNMKPEEHKKFKLLCVAEGKSMNEVVMMLLDKYMREAGEK